MAVSASTIQHCSLLPSTVGAIPKFRIPLSLSFPASTPSLSKLRPRFPFTCSLPSVTSTSSPSSTDTAVLDPSLSLKRKAMDVSPQLKGTSIFLVGKSCSMKTSLGKLLAEILRYYYFDSDSLVEELTGSKNADKSLNEIDEQGFRESETEVLKQLSSMGRLVVCAGDGAVQSSTNLALLRYGISIWIDVPLDMEAVDSELTVSDTPDLEEEVLAEKASEDQDTREGYATADVTISLQKLASKLAYDDLTAVTTEDMTLEVLKEIEKLTRVKKMMEEAATPF